MGDIFEQGGEFMYVLSAWALFTLLLIADRLYGLFIRCRLDADRMTRQVIASLDRDHGFARALEQVSEQPRQPVAAVLKAGLLKGNRSDREILRAMEESILKETPRIETRGAFLAAMIRLAPLTGLLGTLFGLIGTFKGLTPPAGSNPEGSFAQGLTGALYPLTYGLCIAVVAFLAHTVVAARQKQMVAAMKSSSATLLNDLSERNRQAVRLRDTECPNPTSGTGGAA